jgi:hypothetical protein
VCVKRECDTTWRDPAPIAIPKAQCRALGAGLFLIARAADSDDASPMAPRTSLTGCRRRRNPTDPGFDPGCPAKLFQASPSPAKLNQAKLLGLAWFYSSESGLFNGLQRFPNKNFSPHPSAGKRVATRAFVSAHLHNVARILLFRKAPNRKIVASPIRLRRPVYAPIERSKRSPNARCSVATNSRFSGASLSTPTA